MEGILSASVKGVQSTLQISTSGFFLKFNLNLSASNPSRLSLTLIKFFHCSFFFISSSSKLNHIRQVLVTMDWLCCWLIVEPAWWLLHLLSLKHLILSQFSHKKIAHLIQVPHLVMTGNCGRWSPVTSWYKTWWLGAFTRIFFREAMKSFTLL